MFNCRLSRTRRISENRFGILFRRPFSLEAEKVRIVVLATITLHNWLRKDSSYGKVYISSELVDNEDITTGEITEGAWRKDPPTESWYVMLVPKFNNPT